MSNVKVWRYSLPNDDEFYEGWGIIFIDSTGIVTAVTDYGNYAQSFSYRGEDFRDFLIKCDSDYLLRKFSKATELNQEETQKNIQEYILRNRYDESFSSEKARKEWNLVKEYDFYYTEEVNDWMQETTISEPWNLLVYDHPASAKAFVNRLFPRLVELLKKDREKAAS